MRVALVQLNSQDDVEANLAAAEQFIDRAKTVEQADLVVLPEYFAFLDDDPDKRRASGSHFDIVRERMSEAARRNGIYVHAGSIVEPKDDRTYNTTLVFDPEGREIARYRKIHLFDIDSPNGTIHRESHFVAPGADVVTYRIGDLTVGCAICYDLRFPELFRALRDQGADLIVLPAAFTLATGKDHWEVLIRARAIETQTYFCAAGQVQNYAQGRRSSWGHSMIVDPWGEVIAKTSDGVGTTSAPVDRRYIEKVRLSIPVADHHILK